MAGLGMLVHLLICHPDILHLYHTILCSYILLYVALLMGTIYLSN